MRKLIALSTERGSLPDVNVWIALASDRHEHHSIARRWFGSTIHVAHFCRITQMAFRRLLTNRKVMGGDVLSPIEVLAVYAGLLADERVQFAFEPESVEKAWMRLMHVPAASGSVWTDAYLVAFAEETGLRLLTFDAGMSRWHSQAVEVLES